MAARPMRYVFWGVQMTQRVGREARAAGIPAEDYVATRAPAGELLGALQGAA